MFFEITGQIHIPKMSMNVLYEYIYQSYIYQSYIYMNIYISEYIFKLDVMTRNIICLLQTIQDDGWMMF